MQMKRTVQIKRLWLVNNKTSQLKPFFYIEEHQLGLYQLIEIFKTLFVDSIVDFFCEDQNMKQIARHFVLIQKCNITQPYVTNHIHSFSKVKRHDRTCLQRKYKVFLLDAINALDLHQIFQYSALRFQVGAYQQKAAKVQLPGNELVHRWFFVNCRKPWFIPWAFEMYLWLHYS